MTAVNARTRAGAVLASALLIAAVACNREQRAETRADADTLAAKTDTTISSAGEAVRTTLSVIDVDMGKGVDTDRKISDKTDEFKPTDTIYASVHTSGTATNGAVTGRWTYEDGSVIEEKTNTVTTSGDDYTTFSLANASGLKKGKYTLHVIVDGKEVRTKDVTVK